MQNLIVRLDPSLFRSIRLFGKVLLKIKGAARIHKMLDCFLVLILNELLSF